MKKLVVIDGNAILHKAYHALPPFKTEAGELVNAVYGFATVVLNLLNQQEPDYIAVAFDVKGGTFRHEKSPEYKANRTKAPDDLYSQLPRIKLLMNAFQIPIYEQFGFEADDVLGALAKEADQLGDVSTYIVTGDLDTLQLVGERVRVLAMHRGFSRPIIFDRAAVFERYGLWPEQIIDMKALQGDSSDNIKGVPGIGKKTAANLLQQFETLEGVYKNVESLKGAVKRKLEEGKESAFLSQELATIVCEVPGIKLNLEEAKVHQYDQDAVGKMFEELGFKSLLAKLGRFERRAASLMAENNPSQQSLF